MLTPRILLAFLAVTVSSSLNPEPHPFAALLKRQQPGTPSYNCHDNCGTAITLSKSNRDTCNDVVFLFDYKNCLQCAGPDNHNIWRYYGGSLSAAAQKCGLETEPKSGKQDDVPEAKHPGEQSGSTSEPKPTPTAAPATTAVSAGTTTASVTRESSMSNTAVIQTNTLSVSRRPATPTTGTESFTSSTLSAEFTGGVAALRVADVVPAFGFAVLGVAFGFGN